MKIIPVGKPKATNRDLTKLEPVLNFDLRQGDVLQVGRYRNIEVQVMGFARDENNQPVVVTRGDDGKVSETKVFGFRVAKVMPAKRMASVAREPGMRTYRPDGNYKQFPINEILELSQKDVHLYCRNCRHGNNLTDWMRENMSKLPKKLTIRQLLSPKTRPVCEQCFEPLYSHQVKAKFDLQVLNTQLDRLRNSTP